MYRVFRKSIEVPWLLVVASAGSGDITGSGQLDQKSGDFVTRSATGLVGH